MPEFTIEKDIAAPRERVFAEATDLAHAAEKIRGILKVEILTDGPVGLGTRFRETRVMFKREATEEMEITAFDPPSGYALGAESHGCRYHTEVRLEPDGEGTRLRMRFRAEPVTLPAKLLSFMLRPMLKVGMKEVDKDLDDIKAAAEDAAQPG